MRKPKKEAPRCVEYFYITDNSTGFLISGIARKSYSGCRYSVTYCAAGKYEWARRFTSVDSAKAYIRQFDLRGVSIIDAAGRVKYIYPEMEVLCID